MDRSKSTLHRGLTVATVLVVGLSAPLTWAQETEFEEAFVFFELNNTDGDLGIHAKVDGGPWTFMTISDRNDARILRVQSAGRLWRQGVTEIFFESAEPTFDELEPADFFRRFRPGTYTVRGRSKDGVDLVNETEVTWAMPAPPAATVNSQTSPTQCDDEEPGFDIVSVSEPVTISWPAVTMSHPDLGVMPPRGVEIVNYEVVVEADLDIDGEEFTTVYSVSLPPDVTSMSVPSEFLAQTDEFKFEVLARESSYNQTAMESCFALE